MTERQQWEADNLELGRRVAWAFTSGDSKHEIWWRWFSKIFPDI